MVASAALRVLLHEVPVGVLSLNSSSGADFHFLDTYKKMYPRNVLGQAFLDDLDKIHHVRLRTPSWFSNLLPEGALRELVVQHTGVAAVHEFQLLLKLGDDLPGAVRLVADDAVDLQGMLPGEPEQPEPGEDVWHFSLAGVQLKFSALRTGKGLTIPASGKGGEWIVKLPDARYERVPQNEFATMQWARASGIVTPEFELTSLDAITGLPREAESLRERLAFVIRRFDRADVGRVHIEDFAQLLGLFPEQKYTRFNYETIGNLVHGIAGRGDFEEYIQRLVFTVISGNGDAHHKNWSLIYRDGVNASLSPAYDLVSTIQYLREDRLALNLSGSKKWEDVSLRSFTRMARNTGEAESEIADWVRRAVERTMDAWSSADFGFDAGQRQLLEAHFRRLNLR